MDFPQTVKLVNALLLATSDSPNVFTKFGEHVKALHDECLAERPTERDAPPPPANVWASTREPVASAKKFLKKEMSRRGKDKLIRSFNDTFIQRAIRNPSRRKKGGKLILSIYRTIRTIFAAIEARATWPNTARRTRPTEHGPRRVEGRGPRHNPAPDPAQGVAQHVPTLHPAQHYGLPASYDFPPRMAVRSHPGLGGQGVSRLSLLVATPLLPLLASPALPPGR